MEDYYEAVARQDWDYTYINLDSRTRRMFTKEEWDQKNQWFADNGSLELSSFEITQFSTTLTSTPRWWWRSIATSPPATAHLTCRP